MERKQFLAGFGLAGAALTAAGIASAADNTTTTLGPGCGPHPVPIASGSSPRPHVPHQRVNSVESAYRRVERLIEELSKDPNDYGGFKTKALTDLGQASSDLQQAVAYEQAHPASTTMPL